jgi:hypothetical protein
MTKLIRRNLMLLGAALFAVTMVTSGDANAAGGTTFNSIASAIIGSTSGLPFLLSSLSYMFGVLLAVLGIMKIKDHVENPGQTPLKDGAIRLLAGGGLFAVPVVSTAMLNTVGSGGNVSQATGLGSLTFSG